MPDHLITCPRCRQPLRVPDTAVGKPARCPHCQAAFHLPARPDGSPGELILRWGLPRPLVVPAFGLLMLGLAGTLVNGYLSALFFFQPGAELEFARGRVREVRSAEAMSGAMRPPEEWSHAPRAAAAGVAAAAVTAEAVEEQANEGLAASWAPGMKPLHLVSTAVSALALLGGIAILRGRWYPLALAGCLAAILNVNHLCCLPGAVAGVWGVMALVRDDVRDHFRRR